MWTGEAYGVILWMGQRKIGLPNGLPQVILLVDTGCLGCCSAIQLRARVPSQRKESQPDQRISRPGHPSAIQPKFPIKRTCLPRRALFNIHVFTIVLKCHNPQWHLNLYFTFHLYLYLYLYSIFLSVVLREKRSPSHRI